MNVELLRAVQEKIKAAPKSLDMSGWGRRDDCGTAACIGGWGLLLSGEAKISESGFLVTDSRGPSEVAAAVFGLNVGQAERLFHLRYWPAEFRDIDSFEPIDAAARIDHFIATEGRE